jgi:hypothetical protein
VMSHCARNPAARDWAHAYKSLMSKLVQLINVLVEQKHHHRVSRVAHILNRHFPELIESPALPAKLIRIALSTPIDVVITEDPEALNAVPISQQRLTYSDAEGEHASKSSDFPHPLNFSADIESSPNATQWHSEIQEEQMKKEYMKEELKKLKEKKNQSESSPLPPPIFPSLPSNGARPSFRASVIDPALYGPLHESNGDPLHSLDFAKIVATLSSSRFQDELQKACFSDLPVWKDPLEGTPTDAELAPIQEAMRRMKAAQHKITGVRN